MSGYQKIALRTALRSDLDDITRLWRESALTMDGLPRDVPSEEALRARIDTELGSGWALSVALIADRPVGFLAIKPADAVLDQIFVALTEQGRGIGSLLIDAAKSGMPNGFTLRMDAQNGLARRFYVKHGLSLVSEGTHAPTGIPVHFYGWNGR